MLPCWHYRREGPPSFVIAIRALMDFCYLAQSQQLDNYSLSQLSASLELFHEHKQEILDFGARVGKGGKWMIISKSPASSSRGS